jgi:hypothetical protein
MTAFTRDRAGVLILRCWTEGDPATGLRVRIVAASDPAVSESPVTLVTDVASRRRGSVRVAGRVHRRDRGAAGARVTPR